MYVVKNSDFWKMSKKGFGGCTPPSHQRLINYPPQKKKHYLHRHLMTILVTKRIHEITHFRKNGLFGLFCKNDEFRDFPRCYQTVPPDQRIFLKKYPRIKNALRHCVGTLALER